MKRRKRKDGNVERRGNGMTKKATSKRTARAIILVSGRGTRLWPLTSNDTAKAHIKADTRQTLLYATAKRLTAISNINGVIAVCEKGHQEKTRKTLAQAGLENAVVITEKDPRGTATTFAFGALQAITDQGDGPPPTIVAVPVDHWIERVEALDRAVNEACEEAGDARVCAVGAYPEIREPEYGYLLRGEPSGRTKTGAEINRFIEHPTPTLTYSLNPSNGWRWNTGMYAMNADAYLERMRDADARAHDACVRAYGQRVQVNQTVHTAKIDVPRGNEVSLEAVFDGGAIERLAVELKCRWRDIGAWQGLAATQDKDGNGNTIDGPVLAKEMRNSYVRASTRQIIAIGLDDVIIVEGPHGVLVTRKERDGIEGALKSAVRTLAQ